jgi:hypothetical protein
MAIAGVLWLRSYDPLAWSGGTFGAPTGSLEWKAVDDGVHGPVYYVSAEEPGTFEVGVDVSNTGSLGVELLGLQGASDVAALRMGSDGSWVNSSRANGLTGALVPFRPVTVESGEGRYLVLQFEVTEQTRCGPNYAPGTFRQYDGVDLRYRYAGGFERHGTFETPFTVVLICGDLP